MVFIPAECGIKTMLFGIKTIALRGPNGPNFFDLKTNEVSYESPA
jgi:hypothetical protein